MCQLEATQEPPDREAVDAYAVVIRQFAHQIVQRQIRLLGHPRRDPIPQADQLAVTPATALSARCQPARRALEDHHVVHELHRNPEPHGGCTVRMPFLQKSDDALPERDRMWLTHLKPPYLLCRQGITEHSSWES